MAQRTLEPHHLSPLLSDTRADCPDISLENLTMKSSRLPAFPNTHSIHYFHILHPARELSFVVQSRRTVRHPQYPRRKQYSTKTNSQSCISRKKLPFIAISFKLNLITPKILRCKDALSGRGGGVKCDGREFSRFLFCHAHVFLRRPQGRRASRRGASEPVSHRELCRV